MKRICLTLLMSIPLLSPITAYAQDEAKEIEAQIESLQKKLDALNEVSDESDGASNEVDKSNWGKRSSPVPLGESIEVIDKEYGAEETFSARLNLKIDNIIRGEEAYDILISENRFNEPAPEGLEWAIIELEVEYLNGSEDYPYSPRIRFDIFDATGKQVDQSDWGTLSVHFSDTDIFPGVTHSGREVYLVPEGEDFLLATNLESLYFFDNK